MLARTTVDVVVSGEPIHKWPPVCETTTVLFDSGIPGFDGDC